ncbi:MAG TPA: HAMP domain-containing histidine kinase, partial [Candidatus Protoclostridium stercorigallinarum]|nr:HAMP domain-containing histidine kinase [Candidatus Protoclostridium stercorigallinarum]
ILNYSAIDDDTVKSYDVNVSQLTNEVLNNFTPMLKEKGLKMIRSIDDGIVIKATHERITEILDNLVSNAIKYNKENGKIAITLKGSVLTVEDTGIGIPSEELPHIFSRFYTVDKSHGESVGFGLGLPIVKKLCDRSGWKLSVDSVVGEGTTFKVDFGAAEREKGSSKN